MYKLIKWYNQNRKKFWTSIIIIAFIWIIIHLLNSWAETENEKERKKEKSISKTNNISYEKQSKSIISEGSVDETYQDKFGNLIDRFLKNCNEHNYEEAYQLLTEDCKEERYPSLKMFIDQYCNDKFEEKKEYNFQSWTTKGNYIYLIKIYENMLSTGNANTNYIQDYYTIKKEKNEYKLNISGFVGKQKYKNKTGQKDEINIELNHTNVYMDYQSYKITVKNNTDNTIMLDSYNQTDKTYTVDSNGVKIEALIHENKENDLILKPKEEKEITIKFSNVYQSGTTIRKIVFSNIIPNYEDYNNNKEKYNEFKEIEIEI